MTIENQEQVAKWIDELYSFEVYKDAFELRQNNPFECKQICAVNFLYNKLKLEHRNEKYFFHGEHDMLYIGSSFDLFDDFTKDEVHEMMVYGIQLSDDGDGFRIYASM